MSSTERVSIEEAMKRLIEVNVANGNRITQLERQMEEIIKSFAEYREQHTSSSRDELTKMSETIESIRSMTVSCYEEGTSRFQSNQQQLQHMCNDVNLNRNGIVNRSHQIAGESGGVASYTIDENKGEMEGHAIGQSKAEVSPPETRTQTRNDVLGQPSQTTPILRESDVTHIRMASRVDSVNNRVKHSTISVSSPSASPEFYGRYTESPTQFLIRVQEYAQSVHSWDLATLVNGMSHFLRDSALEWYCQLQLSHRLPRTWTEFTELFLAHFNTPLRQAHQAREWHACWQGESESIDEFLVRLRALWREHKRKETERDLVKHLFCRMRNDVLSTIEISCNASLDEVVSEVRKIEGVLHRRARKEDDARLGKANETSNIDECEIVKN